MAFKRRSAATPASLLGLKAGVSMLNSTTSSLPTSRSHDNSRGYRCWIALSKWFFQSFLLALTIPSTPSINSTMMPSFHWFRSFSSPRMITTSPFVRLQDSDLFFILCRSRNPRIYSFVQRDQRACLYFFRNFGLFLNAPSSWWYAFCSGNWLDCVNSNAFGVKTGICRSLST